MSYPSRPSYKNNGQRPGNSRYGHQPSYSVPEPSRSAVAANVRRGPPKPHGSSKPQGRSSTYSYKAGSSSSSRNSKSQQVQPRGKTVGNYVLSKAIGEGTFGKVRSGTHTVTGEKVAVKILEKARIVEVADFKRVRLEIDILKRNRHRNVIQLFEHIEKETTIFLVMENADGGELFDYIVSHQRIAEPLAMSFFKQICDGAEYLHKMEVTHRDLKPENLLLQSSKEGWIIKIVDFGLSNTHEGGRTLQTACGSPCYAAPEMIEGKRYVGPKADIWSMGVILFAMVCGHLPFENSNTKMLYAQICRGEYKAPDYISSEVRDLIRRILNVDPELRLSIDQIRRHPWFTDTYQAPPSPMPTSDKMSLDKDVMKQLKELKIDTNQVGEALKTGRHNDEKQHLTASYYLLCNRKRRNKEKQELRDALYEKEDKKNRTNVGGSPKSIAMSLNPIQTHSNKSTPKGSNKNTPNGGSRTLELVPPSSSSRPNQIPKLELGAVTQSIPSAPTALPDVTNTSGGKPPKGGRQARASLRAVNQPTGSQTSRIPSSNPVTSIPVQPHSARVSAPVQYPDGPPVGIAPWDVANIERPVTRSSSRGESRNGRRPVPDQVKATVGLLGVEPPGRTNQLKSIPDETSNTERPKHPVAPTLPMNGISTTDVPKQPSAPPSRPAEKRGSKTHRKIVDPSQQNGSANVEYDKKKVTSAIPTVISSTSSKPMKTLYNEMNKACKSHNIKVKPTVPSNSTESLSITCTTQLITTSPPLVFTLEVQRLGDMERMYVLKGAMLKGRVNEFEKVCRVLFSAMKLI